MYARPVVHTARTPNAAGGKATAAKGAGKGTSSSDGASSSYQAATAAADPSRGAGSSSGAGAGAGSSSGAGAGSSSGSSSSRGRQAAPDRSGASSSSVAPWLEADFSDDDDDFTLYDGGSYSRGTHNSSRQQGERSCSSSSRSRGRLIKPQRTVPKGAAVTPAVASAACPVINTPLGRSPGTGGFHCGSWGAAGKSPNSGGGMWAAAAALGTPGSAGSSSQVAGSAPGSGRRARRNARRAALDAGDDE